jgi:hypothetical protein
VGGTVDPKTGQVIWELRVPLTDQLSYYHAHPPRCLEGLTCTPARLTDFAFDGHGEPVNALFQVACPCGSELFTSLAHREDGEFVPPIHLECDGCAATRVIFDPRHHGYDGALGNNGSREVPAELAELGLSDVDLPHPVIVRFEFASEILGDDQWAGRERDLFTWITILARSVDGEEVVQLFDYECA